MQQTERPAESGQTLDIAQSRAAVADEVLAAMGRRRVNRTALAKALGMSRPALAARLDGGKAFDTDELLVVSAFLGVPFLELLAPATGDLAALERIGYAKASA